MNIIQAVLLGLLAGLAIWDSRVGGILMIDRPLVLGPLVGLILGDFVTGIIVGGSLELVMMGVLPLLILFQGQFLQQHLRLFQSWISVLLLH